MHRMQPYGWLHPKDAFKELLLPKVMKASQRRSFCATVLQKNRWYDGIPLCLSKRSMKTLRRTVSLCNCPLKIAGTVYDGM